VQEDEELPSSGVASWLAELRGTWEHDLAGAEPDEAIDRLGPGDIDVEQQQTHRDVVAPQQSAEFASPFCLASWRLTIDAEM
jgi:hypothetical protein